MITMCKHCCRKLMRYVSEFMKAKATEIESKKTRCSRLRNNMMPCIINFKFYLEDQERKEKTWWRTYKD